MKKFIVCALLILAVTAVSAWEFNGINQRKTIVYRPAPGRFAMTVAFKLTMPARILTPGSRKGSVLYPLSVNAVSPGKNMVGKIMLAFVTKPYDRYCFASITPGGRYNIAWTHDGGEIPTDKPVWVFLSAAAGGIFEARINKRCYSHVRSPQLMPLVQSAPEYRFTFGCNPYKGGTGYTECTITDFMIFERVLSTGEMQMIETNPGSAPDIPGFVHLKY